MTYLLLIFVIILCLPSLALLVNNKNCVHDDDCRKGQGCSDAGNCVCKSGIKSDAASCPPQCTSNVDCNSTSLVCQGNKCVCKNDDTPVWDWRRQSCRGCYDSEECGEYHECLKQKCECYTEFYHLINGECAACKTNGDCGQNRICLDKAVTTPQKCICATGYIWNLDDFKCKPISCANNPCGGVSECIDEPNMEQHFRCVCPEDLFGDGYHCHDSPCYNYPCHNGGTCLKQNNGYSCLCPIGFTGGQCKEELKKDKTLHWCQRDEECLYGGTCNGSECICLNGHSGPFCEVLDYQSYLDYPRINFAGIIEADVSTMQNFMDNYEASVDPLLRPHNLSSNPKGSGVWRLRKAHVTSAFIKKRQEKICSINDNMDKVVHAVVKDTSLRASAKLVDFDVEMQTVRTIYGWTIEVENFFKGDFQPVPFQYIWNKNKDRAYSEYGAVSQSILNNVQFGYRADESEIVKFFKRNVDNDKIKLSIHFNIDRYSTDSRRSDFNTARIVGSIGISGPRSPPYFTLGRILEPVNDKRFWYLPFVQRSNRILLDIGNSFQIEANGKVSKNVGQLRLGFLKFGDSEPDCHNVENESDEWSPQNNDYEVTSGIMDMLINKEIDVFIKRLVLMELNSRKQCSKIVLAEEKDGIALHPFTNWAVRTDSEETSTVQLLLTRYGEVVCDKDLISVKKDDSYTGTKFLPRKPPINDPSVECLEDQKLKVSFQIPKGVKNPRPFIDGQIYTFQYYFTGNKFNTKKDIYKSLNSMIALFVYSEYPIPTKPCWLRHVKPIFQQYAKLYPVMKTHFFDLANYDEVVSNKRGIIRSMSLNEDDPNYMPVTRDLSKPKKDMILKWLAEDKPCYGAINFAVNVQMLEELLQTALKLEHSTIPPYLNGYFSLKKSHNTQVKAMMKSILISEMHHLAIVANIINAIGGHPDLLAPDFVPSYPSYLPGGCHPDHKISINKMSTLQIRDAYMVIEQPARELKEGGLMKTINKIIKDKQISRESNKPSSKKNKSCTKKSESCPNEEETSHYLYAEDKLACKEIEDIFVTTFGDINGIIENHDTIGQLYAKILILLSKLECDEMITYHTNVPQVEVRDEVFKVDSYISAVRAIEKIVTEGEGASACNPLDDSTELSHYYKFGSMVNRRHIETFKQENKVEPTNQDIKDIEHCSGTFAFTGRYLPFNEDGVWPMVSDPKMEMYQEGSKARYLAMQFNNTYFELLKNIQHVFDATNYTDTFRDSFGIMKQLLIIGDRLVQVALKDGGDPNIGPNAGPIYPSYP